MYVLACAAAFAAAYLLNITWISIFYHRGLAHRALDLSPRMVRFVAATGPWVTGMDPASWVCMHRLHHTHSDTTEDPHSPTNVGLLGVLLAQLHSYRRVQRRLNRGDPETLQVIEDLPFGPSWLNRRGFALVPYVTHAVILIAIALATGAWLLSAALWVGLMSHPIQGWAVNALGHAVGDRNFETDDDSRNNHLVAWLIAGEGYQNNHHAHPASARFGFHRGEVDPGWWICQLFEGLGLLVIRRDLLIAHVLSEARTAEQPEPGEESVVFLPGRAA